MLHLLVLVFSLLVFVTWDGKHTMNPKQVKSRVCSTYYQNKVEPISKTKSKKTPKEHFGRFSLTR
jgi:hypothetical protein